MIETKRDGGNVVIWVDVDIPTWETRCFPFTYHASSEGYAGLLIGAIEERFSSQLRAIRQEAYLQGYKAAKSKMRKETWFSGHMP